MFPVKSSAEQRPLLSKHPSSEEKHILLPGSVFQVKHILQFFSSVISRVKGQLSLTLTHVQSRVSSSNLGFERAWTWTSCLISGISFVIQPWQLVFGSDPRLSACYLKSVLICTSTTRNFELLVKQSHWYWCFYMIYINTWGYDWIGVWNEKASYFKEYWALTWVIPQPEERSCSVVCWYGGGYFCNCSRTKWLIV